jgi:alkanesulfonate monooxygenase SsuD/methylene tetrahydromethanopterin reductase-like flavin-dependent oxidoreductase (luciferase family)
MAKIALGLDNLATSYEERAAAAEEAARLGYDSLWLAEGNGSTDAFILAGQAWNASRAVVSEGLAIGLSITPVTLRTPLAIAMSARTLSELTGGRFILGIGSGRTDGADVTQAYGVAKLSPLELMRDYLVTLRRLLDGETVDYDGPVIKLRGARLLTDTPPRTPLNIGAMGAEMLRLGGELAEGVSLSWNTPSLVNWSRERIAEGAVRGGRDPASVGVMGSVRMAIDDDVDAARRALAKGALGYIMEKPVGFLPPGQRKAYRAQFERIGAGEVIKTLDQMQARGASAIEMADGIPEEIIRETGYYGPASGAAEALKRLAAQLDRVIVRLVSVSPGTDAALKAMRACAPSSSGS